VDGTALMPGCLRPELFPGIGVLSDDRMLDHHFFVNFVAAEMPTEIRFEHDSQTAVRDYLRAKLMLQSRVQIKAFDVSESKWFDAPIMQTITGPATESHVVNRGTPVAPLDSRS